MINKAVVQLSEKLHTINYVFAKKPIVIGGMAMEYYGIRKAGADVDFVVCDHDYQALASIYPENLKDIYGDLGVIIDSFEIWRSIALLDYDFFDTGTVEYDEVKVISLDKLLLMRVCAMEVEKYKKDLELMVEHYYKLFRNQDFLHEAETHISSYEKNNGIIWAGNYQDT